MSSGLGNQEVARPCSEPEEFSVPGAEQKKKHNGLDHAWEMRTQTGVDGSPGRGASLVGGGTALSLQTPLDVFILKHIHTCLPKRMYSRD